ncbi:MAG: thermonuclease family protein [Candidatus Kaiserbacteria bacterium]|nr:thermonuclease family protein [Candidatus Kaiserbacteria bacterium]
MTGRQFASGFVFGLMAGILLAQLHLIPANQAHEALSEVAATTTNAAEVQNDWYPVVKVVDGDTIDVSKDGKTVRIRLIGLDTPEVVDPRKPVQCFGKEASAEMKKLISSQSVRLEYDASQGRLDKYGRTLAYVYAPLNSNPEGLLVNKYMIAEGYGHEYTYAIPYKYQKDFKAAETAAREAQKGLWAPGVCGN